MVGKSAQTHQRIHPQIAQFNRQSRGGVVNKGCRIRKVTCNGRREVSNFFRGARLGYNPAAYGADRPRVGPELTGRRHGMQSEFKHGYC
jgi:hypothetical protein